MSIPVNLPRDLNWQGWTKYCGSIVQYFETEILGRKCKLPCKDCGFYYLTSEGDYLDLNENGEPIENEKTPMCGVW